MEPITYSHEDTRLKQEKENRSFLTINCDSLVNLINRETKQYQGSKPGANHHLGNS